MVAACHTATSYFNLWLKAEGYSVTETNYLPTGGNALAIVVTIFMGMLADKTGWYYWILMVLQIVMILANILLSVWTIPKAALMFAYYISYAGSASTPVLIVRLPSTMRSVDVVVLTRLQSWINNENANDPNTRQLLVASANVLSYAWVLWVPRES